MAAAVLSIQKGAVGEANAAKDRTLGEGPDVWLQDVRELPVAGDRFHLSDGVSQRDAERALRRLIKGAMLRG